MSLLWRGVGDVLGADDLELDRAGSVALEVSGPNEDGWNQYLEGRDGWSDTDGDGTYSCTRVDEVFVRITEFRLTFDT